MFEKSTLEVRFLFLVETPRLIVENSTVRNPNYITTTVYFFQFQICSSVGAANFHVC
jgi:hypothetical protein